MVFPQIRTPNFAAAAASAEQVHAARLRNVAAGMQIDQVRKRNQNLQQLRQMRSQFDNGAQIVRQLREDGNFEAAELFIEQQREQRTSTVKFLREVGPMIRDADTYERLRGDLIREGAVEEDDLPVDYNQSFFAREAKKQELKLKEFMKEVGVSEGGITQEQQVIMDQFGREVHTGPVRGDIRERELQQRTRQQRLQLAQRRREAGRKTEQERLKTATSNTIARNVAAFYGGSFNTKTQQFEIAGRGNRQAAVRVMAQAERYAEMGMAPLQAAQQALSDEQEPGVGASPSVVGPPASAAGPARFDPAGFLKRRGMQ